MPLLRLASLLVLSLCYFNCILSNAEGCASGNAGLHSIGSSACLRCWNGLWHSWLHRDCSLHGWHGVLEGRDCVCVCVTARSGFLARNGLSLIHVYLFLHSSRTLVWVSSAPCPALDPAFTKTWVVVLLHKALSSLVCCTCLFFSSSFPSSSRLQTESTSKLLTVVCGHTHILCLHPFCTLTPTLVIGTADVESGLQKIAPCTVLSGGKVTTLDPHELSRQIRGVRLGTWDSFVVLQCDLIASVFPFCVDQTTALFFLIMAHRAHFACLISRSWHRMKW